MTRSRLLLIDDDLEFLEAASNVLGVEHDVTSVTSPEDAFSLLREMEFEIILCDLHMPFRSDERASEYMLSYEVGIRTAKELQWVFPDRPVIALSAAPFSDLQRIEKSLYPVRAFSKPTRAHDLQLLVREVLKGDEASALPQ